MLSYINKKTHNLYSNFTADVHLHTTAIVHLKNVSLIFLCA